MEASTTGGGIFITFEGSEGCGKSTQIRMLAEAFRARGREPLVLREPGGTPAGEVIRHLLKHDPAGDDLTPEAELLLFAASRAQLVREVIRPALAAGRAVISDRFHDSTTVYQGVARRICPEDTARINGFAVGGCVPDITFLLDLDRATAVARMRGRGQAADRIERAPEEFFAAVRRGYLEAAAREPSRIRVLDASEPADVIAGKIASVVF
jgi:dTMP kinase